MKNIIYLLCMVGIACHAQEKWTLEKCIHYALSHNVDIRRQQESLNLAQDLYKQSKSERLPSLNAEYYHQLSSGRSINTDSYSWENVHMQQGNAQLVGELTIYNGGYVHNYIKQNEYNSEKNQRKLEQAKNEVILMILQAYTDVLFCKENLALSNKQLKQAEEQHSCTNIMVEKGYSGGIDLLELEASIEKEKAGCEDANNNLRNSIIQLKNYMGYHETDLPEFNDVHFTDRQYSLSPDSLYEKALTVLPDFKVYENEIKTLNHNLAAINSNYYPSVKLRGTVTSQYLKDAINEAEPTSNYTYYNQLNNNLNNQLMVVVSIPIFNKNQVKRKQYESLSAIRDLRLQQIDAKTNLMKEIEKICFNIQVAQNKYLSMNESVIKYSEIYEIRAKQYNLGAITFLDYIIAKNNLEEAELELLKAKYSLFYYTQLINFYSGNGITYH